jgi:short-subunit dehydrogenase
MQITKIIIFIIYSKIKFTTIMPYMVDTGLCKKVKIRFENFMALVGTQEAAASIIAAQRKGLQEVSIPRYLYLLAKFARLFPNNAAIVIKDYMEAIVESDM